ncbi:hypothetical protein FVER14953_21122 [Fusarium verticillioides]|nr:hypothetical protein FVER14953_21122 [Fusarium verticillioides]
MLVAVSKAFNATLARPELLVGRGFFGRFNVPVVQATFCIRILLRRDLFEFMLV